MTRDEAIEIILGRCGRRENDTYLQAKCVLEMKMAQENALEKADFKPWFLLSEYMTATCGALEPRMPLPENFLEEHEEGLLWIRTPGTTEYVPLGHDDLDTLEARYLDYEPGIPEAYAIVKNYIVLFPTPDVAYGMRMRAYLKEPTLTYAYGAAEEDDETTNLWLTHAADWLIGETGAKIAGSYVKDAATAAEFEKEAAKAKVRLYVAHVAREEMNRTRSQGDD